MDGDGDIDFLSASYNDDKVAWYENEGFGNFTTGIITTTAFGARSVFATDLDSDGDTDVPSAPEAKASNTTAALGALSVLAGTDTLVTTLTTSTLIGGRETVSFADGDADARRFPERHRRSSNAGPGRDPGRRGRRGHRGCAAHLRDHGQNLGPHDVVVATGWRHERMSEIPDVAAFTLAPDFASPSVVEELYDNGMSSSTTAPTTPVSPRVRPKTISVPV